MTLKKLFNTELKKVSVTIEPDEKTNELAKLFDYEFTGTSEFTLPKFPKLPATFKIGLIVGPSGSGKSLLLNELGTIQIPEWDNNKAIISHFDNVEEGADKLSASGLNNLRSWVKPYGILSNGEKFRADLSRQIQSHALVDEFTSVVDRMVAKSASTAISKHIRKKDITNVIFASCHFDIIEWLCPDWVFYTIDNKFVLGDCLQRPTIKIDIHKCNETLWPLFKEHHYLNASLNKASHMYVALWESRPVGFVAVLRMPHGSIKNAWREHRLVTLPDYQGLGIGPRISEAVGEIYKEQDGRYFSRTAHYRLGEYRNHSPRWKPTSKNRKHRTDIIGMEYKQHKYDTKRICYSHEYIGSTEDC